MRRLYYTGLNKEQIKDLKIPKQTIVRKFHRPRDRPTPRSMKEAPLHGLVHI